jgi:hypothetical protein
MTDRIIAAVLVWNGNTNVYTSDVMHTLIEKDNTNKPILVLFIESILSNLSNIQPGKKKETITERMKLMFIIELANILETKTAVEHDMKK